MQVNNVTQAQLGPYVNEIMKSLPINNYRLFTATDSLIYNFLSKDWRAKIIVMGKKEKTH